MRYKLIYPVALVFFFILFVFIYKDLDQRKNNTYSKKTSTPVEENKKNEQDNGPQIYYPISRYAERLTYRKFGQKVTFDDRPKCGRAFYGIHDSDDLEVFPEEENIDVPVNAVNDGEIAFLTYVDGYGGLMIEKTNLNGEEVLLNYGHIRLDSAKFKVGDQVKSGEELAVLGTGCSSETNGERKHLHFAIHKGSTIDMLGYVQTESGLNEWINPSEFLKQLKATQK